MTPTSLGFGVLGPLQMTVDGTPVALGTPKQRAVLAMLVINRNRPVGIESLITAAWEQWPPAEARASLHSYVSNLRRLLSKNGIDPRSVLVSAPPGYRLNVAETACDIGRFIAEKNAGVQAAAAGKFESASRHLTAALAEWRGPVLDDLVDLQFVDAFAAALVEDKVLVHYRTGRGRNRLWPCVCRDRRTRGADRRALVSRTAVGAADHRLLPHRAPVRRPGRVPPAEGHPGRRPRHRSRPDVAGAARADPAAGAVGHQAVPPRPPRPARSSASTSAPRWVRSTPSGACARSPEPLTR